MNSTFYGQPRPEVTRAWVERTPPHFEFSIKLYQKFTHPRMFRERLANLLPGDVRREAALIDALARPNATDLDAFRRGIEPLASGGRLGALLAQFPASFKDVPASRDYLAEFVERYPELSGVVKTAASPSPLLQPVTPSRTSS